MNWIKGLLIGSGEYFDQIAEKATEQGMTVGHIKLDYEREEIFISELRDGLLCYGHEILLMDDKTPRVFELLQEAKQKNPKVLTILNSSDSNILGLLSKYGFIDIIAHNVDIMEMSLLFRGKKPLMYIPGIGFRSRGNYVVIEKKGLFPEAKKYKSKVIAKK